MIVPNKSAEANDRPRVWLPHESKRCSRDDEASCCENCWKLFFSPSRAESNGKAKEESNGKSATSRPAAAIEGPVKSVSVSVPTIGNGFPEPNSETNSDFPLSVVASALQADASPRSWLWRGFIAAMSVTLFSALWKIGKTTLLAHLVRNMGKGEMLCGYNVTPTIVLYISEEAAWRWVRRRDALGIGDNVHFLFRPFKTKPSGAQWHAFIDYVSREAARIGADLIVFDTLSAFWPVCNENDAGEVQAALMPLWNITARCAILLAHHLNKADGQEAKGSRGSGALPSFVDTIIELRRHDASDRDCHKRIITGYGRDDETPAEVVIELHPQTNEYRGLGNRKGMKRDEIKRTLCGMLPTESPGMTFDEIKDDWPNAEFPRKGIVLETLAEGTERGDWTRDGTGKKGDPFRYFVPSGKPA